MSPARARVGAASARRLVVAGVFGAGLELALVALIALRDAAPGEPLLLRWLRCVVDHPQRATLALGLALWAILPAPRRTAPPTSSAATTADGERALR